MVAEIIRQRDELDRKLVEVFGRPVGKLQILNGDEPNPKPSGHSDAVRAKLSKQMKAVWRARRAKAKELAKA